MRFNNVTEVAVAIESIMEKWNKNNVNKAIDYKALLTLEVVDVCPEEPDTFGFIDATVIYDESVKYHITLIRRITTGSGEVLREEITGCDSDTLIHEVAHFIEMAINPMAVWYDGEYHSPEFWRIKKEISTQRKYKKENDMISPEVVPNSMVVVPKGLIHQEKTREIETETRKETDPEIEIYRVLQDKARSWALSVRENAQFRNVDANELANTAWVVLCEIRGNGKYQELRSRSNTRYERNASINANYDSADQYWVAYRNKYLVGHAIVRLKKENPVPGAIRATHESDYVWLSPEMAHKVSNSWTVKSNLPYGKWYPCITSKGIDRYQFIRDKQGNIIDIDDPHIQCEYVITKDEMGKEYIWLYGVKCYPQEYVVHLEDIVDEVTKAKEGDSVSNSFGDFVMPIIEVDFHNIMSSLISTDKKSFKLIKSYIGMVEPMGFEELTKTLFATAKANGESWETKTKATQAMWNYMIGLREYKEVQALLQKQGLSFRKAVEVLKMAKYFFVRLITVYLNDSARTRNLVDQVLNLTNNTRLHVYAEGPRQSNNADGIRVESDYERNSHIVTSVLNLLKKNGIEIGYKEWKELHDRYGVVPNFSMVPVTDGNQPIPREFQGMVERKH